MLEVKKNSEQEGRRAKEIGPAEAYIELRRIKTYKGVEVNQDETNPSSREFHAFIKATNFARGSYVGSEMRLQR